MRLNEKRHLLMRALELQKRTGHPSMSVSNRPGLFPTLTKPEPLNKRNRLKKRLMDLTAIEEGRNRTGKSPFVEAHYV